MDVRLVAFGILEIDGVRYEHDVVVDEGRVTKRKKGPSKPLRGQYGHTPLSAREAIPWKWSGRWDSNPRHSAWEAACPRDGSSP